MAFFPCRCCFSAVHSMELRMQMCMSTVSESVFVNDAFTSFSLPFICLCIAPKALQFSGLLTMHKIPNEKKNAQKQQQLAAILEKSIKWTCWTRNETSHPILLQNASNCCCCTCIRFGWISVYVTIASRSVAASEKCRIFSCSLRKLYFDINCILSTHSNDWILALYELRMAETDEPHTKKSQFMPMKWMCTMWFIRNDSIFGRFFYGIMDVKLADYLTRFVCLSTRLDVIWVTMNRGKTSRAKVTWSDNM